MKYTIEPLYAPLWNEHEGYISTDILVGYELWDEEGKVIAAAETREELYPIMFGIEAPPLPVPKNRRLIVAR